MANTYKLTFEHLRVVNTIGVMSDVIKELHWRITATSDDVEPIVQSCYGSSVLDDPTEGSFIAYGTVTVADTKTWFEALTDEDGNNLLQSMKDGLDSQIAAKQSPADYSETPGQTFLDGVAV